MKSVLAALVVLSFVFSPAAFAAEVTYVAGMKGVECTGCMRAISRSLGKMKGVKTIRITKVTEGQHRLTVVTDGSASLSKADAVKALGKNAPHYEIVSWKRS